MPRASLGAYDIPGLSAIRRIKDDDVALPYDAHDDDDAGIRYTRLL